MRNIALNSHRKRIMKAGEYQLVLGEKTLIMGILNVTPDSFSDGGDFTEIDIAIKHGIEMENQGADIIDVGGESTRPGSNFVGAVEEINRVVPIIKALREKIKIPISIDTYKASVAEASVKAGAVIINDVWGMQKDLDMPEVVARLGVPVILMHNRENTIYEKDIMEDIIDFFLKSIELGKKAGISENMMIIDPGIGFGKTPEQSMEVMARLGELQDLGFPILLGTSRKSMIGKIMGGISPKERVAGTVATTVMGIIQGAADIVRVHDVPENLQAARVTDAIVRRNPWKKEN